VRWLVISRGTWLTGCKVLIHPSAISREDLEQQQFVVALTKAQIDDSPGLLEDQPVSQQMENQLNSYYGWGPALGRRQSLGAPRRDGFAPDGPAEARGEGRLRGDDPHLRSVVEVTGYHVQAVDGARRSEIDALVYATGGKTYFGKTAELVETAVTVSHFQKAVLKIGNYLVVLALILVAVIVGLGIYRGEPILTLLQFALVLTVAAIPVAMPTVLSATMAVGARLLAKKQTIVSKLAAIEELAGVDVLCADKTGTLTQNKLTLGDPFCLDAITADQLILAGALASQAANNDTIDLAVLGGLKDKDALRPYHVTHVTPFDPVHKRAEATVKGADGKSFKVTKGAPQVILALSANAEAVKAAVDKAVDDFAARGFRAVGVARTASDGKWRLRAVFNRQRDIPSRGQHRLCRVAAPGSGVTRRGTRTSAHACRRANVAHHVGRRRRPDRTARDPPPCEPRRRSAFRTADRLDRRRERAR
jgi:hypothetical protein